MGNLEKAQESFDQAVLVSRQINALPELASAYYHLGLLAKQENHKNKARGYLRQAQEIYRTMETPDCQRIKQEFLELSRESSD
jgi:tetratricopeptide (TPR) repeat protein